MARLPIALARSSIALLSGVSSLPCISRCIPQPVVDTRRCKSWLQQEVSCRVGLVAPPSLIARRKAAFASAGAVISNNEPRPKLRKPRTSARLAIGAGSVTLFDRQVEVFSRQGYGLGVRLLLPARALSNPALTIAETLKFSGSCSRS